MPLESNATARRRYVPETIIVKLVRGRLGELPSRPLPRRAIIGAFYLGRLLIDKSYLRDREFADRSRLRLRRFAVRRVMY